MATGIQKAPARGSDRLADLAFALVTIGALLAVGLTHRDFGIGWDEGAQARYGDLTVEYVRSGFTELRAREYGKSRGYGPALETALSLIAPSEGRERFHTRHLLTGLFGLLVLPALFVCGRATGERWLAVAAAIALLTMPRFLGHLANNAKDIPFAALWSLSLAGLAHLQSTPGRPWGRVLTIGIAIGLAGALRPGGFPLLSGFLALGLLATVVAQGRATGHIRKPLFDALGKAVVALAIAGGLLVLLWPPAHEAPLTRLLSTLANSLDFDRVYPVLFEGRTRPSDALPPWYLVKFLALTTPTPALILGVLGLVAALRRQWASPLSVESRTFFLYQAWLLLPLLAFWWIRPNVYDGLRHFLFLLPALALFAGYGALRLLRAAPRGLPQVLAVAAVCAAVVVSVRDIAQLHPYQSSYFARSSGGLAGAAGRYETDYWATSYGEALAWIREQTRPTQAPTRVLLGATNLAFVGFRHYGDRELSLTGMRPEHVRDEVPAPFDYYVGTYRWGMDQAFPKSPVVHEVSRDGVVFAVVRQAPRPPRSGQG